MSATRKLPTISAILGVAGIGIAAASKESFREKVAKALGINVPGGIWRLLAIMFALMNLKNMPFVWHYRLFKALIYHLFFQPTPIEPIALFKPIITPSHTPITEGDYNFHKSNSTYFTDLDIARTHLITAIMRNGIKGVGSRPEDKGNTGFSLRNTSRAAGHRERRRRQSINPLGTSGVAPSGNNGSEKTQMSEEEWLAAATQPGNLLIALGAVSCHFHREIPLYRRYEVWTRILTWDRKWLYTVSHFVEADTFTPSSYALQPWKKAKTSRKAGNETLSKEQRDKLKRKVFATSIAKYVVKKGRLTIPPEMVLERSQMLPPRPEGTPILGGWTPGPSKTGTPARSTSPDTTASETAVEDEESPVEESAQRVLEESLFPELAQESKEEGWTWEKVQEERVKGLKFAEAFDGLDGLKDFFDMEGGGSMGRYSDLIWKF